MLFFCRTQREIHAMSCPKEGRDLTRSLVTRRGAALQQNVMEASIEKELHLSLFFVSGSLINVQCESIDECCFGARIYHG